jgi:predicted HTH transcriptional regulator
MAYAIDLKELATRESEKVEWKENGEDTKIVGSIVQTISAFANDIANFGGGYIVCGAKETKDEYGFPTVEYKGLNANKLKEIEGKVLQHCRDYVSPAVAPIVQEVENPMDRATRILVFIVVATSEVHTYRNGETATHYVRISRETREARNGILAQLLIKKQKIAYFDKRMNSNATVAAIDVLLFRDSIQEMGLLFPEKSLEDYFSDKEQIAELVPPLFSKGQLDGVLRPKNFTLLLFGKKAAITSNFPDAHLVLSIYKGTGASRL